MVARKRAEGTEPKRLQPATTPEDRENQLIALAYDLAEERLRNGQASSQETTHFLKMGSIREKKEQKRLELENELLATKQELMKSQARIEETYARALQAMRSYTGQDPYALEEGNEHQV